VEKSAETVRATIQCQTCGKCVRLARSVRIRQWLGPLPAGAPEVFRNADTLLIAAERGIGGANIVPPVTEGVIDASHPRYRDVQRWEEQNRRCMEFQRAFICNDCYRFLDNRMGCGVIARNGKARRFGLAGASRGGKAAVYSYTKWRARQAKLAGDCGIDLGP